MYGSVSIAFQPIVCLDTGRVAGAEGLCRFPEDTRWTPERCFINASQIGRGVELELLVVHAALQAARALPAGLFVSVNVSSDALAARELLHLLDTAPIRTDRLILGLTEHEPVKDYAATISLRTDLRDRGIRLAVDDAGAGFASFRHIVRLEPDLIKLDRELVRGIDQDHTQRALTKAVLGFTRDVGSSVVAEGIETAGELRTITELGVPAGQGYLLGRPSNQPRTWQAWGTPRGLGALAETA
jgi:EAL domain-containing protein (putative c-di-GMP-specific phosphodiesterase class I)